MTPVVFHPEAAAEVLDAVRYYETRSPGLGFVFLGEVRHCVEQIADFPESSPVIASDIRRRPFRRFPYNVLYAIETDRILVVAIAHQRRRPSYWRRRL